MHMVEMVIELTPSPLTYLVAVKNRRATTTEVCIEDLT